MAFPAIAAILTLVVFLPALQNGFTNFDDDRNLTKNLEYRGLGLDRLRWMFTTFHVAHFQPLSWLSFGIDYTLWAMNPFGYHLTNLLLHATAAVLCYFLALGLLRRARARSEQNELTSRIGALFASLFFALHPLRVESVAWVTERRDVLSAPLLLVSVLLWLRSTEPGRSRLPLLAASVSAYVLSLLAKSVGVTLPAVLLVLDVYPLRRLDADVRRWSQARNRRVLLEKLPFLALAALGITLAFRAQASSASLEEIPGYGLAARLTVPAFGLLFQLWKTIVPFRLAPLYPRHPGLSGFEIPFILSAAVVLVIAVSLVLARRRLEAPVFALVCFGILQLPVLGVVRIGVQIAADRFGYLPSIPLAILLGGLMAVLVERAVRVRASGAVVLILAGALVWLGILGILSWRQCRIWKDSVSLWSHAIAVQPREALLRNYLGLALLEVNDAAGAVGAFREAARLDPSSADVHSNLGMALSLGGDDAGAVSEFEQAERFHGGSAELYHNWGVLLLRLGRLEDASTRFSQSLELDPSSSGTRGFLATVLARRGLIEGAIEALEAGLPYGPPDGRATDSLAVSAPDAAMARVASWMEHCAARFPAFLGCRYSLAIVRMRTGALAEAAAVLGSILDRDPRATLAYSNLAAICLQARMDSAAAEIARAGLEIEPANAMLQRNRQEAETRVASRQGSEGEGFRDAGNLQVLLERAARALEEGRFAEAREIAALLLEKAPGSAEGRWIREMASGDAPDPRTLFPRERRAHG